MTRLSKRPKRHGGVYSEMDYEFLAGGPHGVACAMTDAEVAGDDNAIREAWEALRDTILPAWIRKRPGTRCWAWWHFDAKQFENGRRRRIDGGVHPFDNAARSLRVAQTDSTSFWNKAYSLRFGLPAAFIFPFDDDLYRDYMANRPGSKIFEGEWEFLVRHNLLVAEDSP